MNKKGASSTIGIILILIVFVIIFVQGFTGLGNVASDTAAVTVPSGIPGLFFQNWNLWVFVIFILSVLWMVFSG